MKKKLIIIFSLVLILLVGIGAVSAEGGNATDNGSPNTLKGSSNGNIATDGVSSGNTDPNLVTAGEIYVNGSVSASGDGSKAKPFKTLKEGYKKSGSSDTIYIASGTYSGFNHNVGLKFEEEITLTTYGDGPVIFDGNGTDWIFHVAKSNVEIRGLTFINSYGSSGYGGAISWGEKNGVLADCTFIDTRGTAGGAVYWNAKNGSISNCTFIRCSGTMGGAIFLNGAEGNISKCSFVGCSVGNDGGGAIYLYDDAKDATISSSVFIDNKADGGGNAIHSLKDFTLRDSIFINNSGGNCDIYAHNKDAITAENNWFGNTYANRTVAPQNHATITNWLYLNTGGDLRTLNRGDCETVNYDLYKYDNSTGEGGVYHSSSMAKMTFKVSSQYGSPDCESVDLVGGHASVLYTALGSKNDLVISNSTFYLKIYYYKYYVNSSVATSGNGSKENPFKNLGDIFEVVDDGDTVYIASGIYKGSENVPAIIDNAITLTTYGEDPVIFDANNENMFFFINSENVTIRGITFVNANSTNNGGSIIWSDKNGVLADCIFINSTSTRERGGAVYWHDFNGTMVNCTFINSTCSGSGGAVYLQGYDNVLSSSVFVNSNGGNGSAVCLSPSGTLTVINNVFINSTGSDYIIYSENSNYTVADYNWFENNYANRTVVPKTYQTNITNWLYLDCDADLHTLNPGESLTVNYNLYNYNSSGKGKIYDASNVPTVTFSASSETGSTNATSISLVKGHASLSYTSRGIKNDLIIRNATFYLRSFNYIYVNGSVGSSGDGSKANPFKTLGEAYDVASDEDTIYIASGTYTGADNVGLTIEKEIKLTTYGDNPVIFDAEKSGRIFNVSADNVEILGITFVNSSYSDSSGGAITWSGANGTLVGCSFIDSVGYSAGAVYWCSQNGTIADCSFINCAAKGVYYGFHYGGSLYVYSLDNCVIANCSFIDSTASTNGGAMYLYNCDNCVIANCSFVHSVAYNSGAAIWYYGINGTLANCSFTNSITWTFGGAVVWYGYGGAVDNCSFDNNIGFYGNIYSEDDLKVMNCIFADAKLTLNVSGNITVGQNETISGTVDDGTNLNSTFELLRDGKGWAVIDVRDGGFSYVYENVPGGIYNLALSNVDIYNNTYGKLMPEASFAVKYIPEINIENPELIHGNDLIISVPGDTSAEVTLTIGGNNYTATPKDGKAIFKTEGFAPNIYKVSVAFAGDDKYENISFASVIDLISRIRIVAPEFVKYYGGNKSFEVTITDNDRTPLEGKAVNITVNGVTYFRNTNSDGKCSLSIRLNSGNYSVFIESDDNSLNSSVCVLSTVNASDITKVYKNATQYWATFRDSEGNYLPVGSTVCFNFEGMLYERVIRNENGSAKLNINLEQGNYVVTAINPITGEMCANNITVLPTIADNRDLVKYYRNASQYVVTLIGDDGKAVGAGEVVTFNINGMLYNRTTNATGQAKLNINLNPGEYIITAEYGGCRVSNNITVKPVLSASDLTKKYGTSDQFVATLLDGQGNPYANQTVRFNINGNFYYRTTDSKGEARLNIRLQAGEYIITSSYNGTNVANKITVLS